MQISLYQLTQIMPKLPASKAQQYLDHLNSAMNEGEINTPLRIAAFLAQLGHESLDLKYFGEIWGPTSAQKDYEPPGSRAKRLGNTQPGDGYKFRGRGPIQLTGRSNYRAASKALNLDLENNPDLASDPDVAFRVAVWFWNSRNLNKYADLRNFDAITYRINGGDNGKEDRDRRYKKAKEVLGI